jgi:hypothetical protein
MKDLLRTVLKDGAVIEAKTAFDATPSYAASCCDWPR